MSNTIRNALDAQARGLPLTAHEEKVMGHATRRHTPGPWQAMVTKTWAGVMAGSHCVCTTGNTQSSHDNTKTAAADNARLIAAAPNLLAALRRFEGRPCESIGLPCMQTGHADCPTCIARAAIQKAEQS
jgi:hypothetical protein